MTGRRPNKKKKNNGRRSSKKRTRRRAHYGGRPDPEPEPEPQLADEHDRIAHLEGSVSSLMEELRISRELVESGEDRLQASRDRLLVCMDLNDEYFEVMSDYQQELTDLRNLVDGSEEE